MRKKVYWLGLAMIVVAVTLVVVMPKSAPAAEVPFVEDGVLKKSRIDNSGAETVIVTGVNRILAETVDGNGVLYAAKNAATQPASEMVSEDIWFVDLSTGEKTMIADRTITASMSSDGIVFAITRDDDTVVYRSGKTGDWRQIGVHGGNAIIVGNGRYVAFIKLADIAADNDRQSLLENAKGIALYDIKTGEERLLTHTEHGEDFGPLALSADGKMLYFNSGRASDEGFPAIHNVGLWAVDIDGKNLRQLTNKSTYFSGTTVPIIDRAALWTSDRTMAISAGSGEIWQYTFRNDGNVDAKKIGDGDQPHWSVRDRQIIVRAKDGGKTKWNKIDITH